MYFQTWWQVGDMSLSEPMNTQLHIYPCFWTTEDHYIGSHWVIHSYAEVQALMS